MREYLKIAFRNLLRYKRRTVLTGIAILVGSFILTFGQAIGDGIARQLISNMIALNTGHITVTLKNDMKADDTSAQIANWKKQIIKNPSDIKSELLKQPGVKSVAQRININGLITNGKKLSSGVIVGIEPDMEQDLLKQGIPLDEGAILEKNDSEHCVYISHSTSRLYNVGVGDTLTLIAQTADGKTNTLEVRVKGIFKKNPWKEYFSYISLNDAQSLTGLGDGVTQFKVMLDNQKSSNATSKQLESLLGDKYNLNISDWEAAGGFFLGTVLIVKMMVIILCITLFIVIAAILMNTMSMAVFERTKEIGTIMAMGTTRRQVLMLFLMEAVILSVIAAGLGVGLSSGLSLVLGNVGIPAFNDAMRLGFGADYTYPYLTIINILTSFFTVIALTVVSSYSPALKASRLEPVKALNYV